MSRAERLLELIQLLRSHRYPVSGAKLSAELGRSLRTIYRDIDALRAQGARIDGEPGIGYILRPGFLLPPMMFSEEEIEALVLGSRWVAQRTDTPLALAARNALSKIATVLPADLREELDSSGLLVPKSLLIAAGDSEMPTIRRAVRREHKLSIRYQDQHGAESERTIWPFAVAFFDQARVILAWCELRADYRSFRTDRIISLRTHEQRYPRRRQALLKEWRERKGLPE